MKYTTIEFGIENGIARIKLNRPEVLNAWNWKMSQEVNDAVQKVNKARDVRVLILSGNGRAFCAGHDLTELAKEGGYPTDLLKLIEYERGKYINPKENLRRVKVPTIAQVHGYVIAGGFVIMNMCDLIIAAEGTKMGMYGVKFGPPPDENFAYLWMMPLRKMKEMVFTGRLYDAEEFYRDGLVNKVVPLEKLEEEVMVLAKEISDINPVTTRLTKESINLMLDIMGYSATQLTGALYHFIGHELFTGGEVGKELFRAQAKLGTKWFIEKTREGAFRDFETEARTIQEDLKKQKKQKGQV
jgi:enoyl-CoA hydratase